MASKRKQPSRQGATMESALVESYSPAGGIFGLSPSDDGRKKSKDQLMWEKYTLTPDYDGHLWRKYGQKSIKGCLYPRLYFRCSYNQDTQCIATKLLQQHSDIPNLYKVTYINEHTCNAAPVPAPDIMAIAEAELPAAAASCNGLVLRFDSCGSSSWTQQERQSQQTVSWSPSQTISFDSSNSQQKQQPVFSFNVPTQAAPSSSSWFPMAESFPASSPNDDDQDDIISTWNSFRYDLEDHLLHFNDHVDFPGNMEL